MAPKFVVYLNIIDTVGWHNPVGRFNGNFIALSEWKNIIYLYCRTMIQVKTNIYILSKCTVWVQRKYRCIKNANIQYSVDKLLMYYSSALWMNHMENEYAAKLP